MHQRKLTVLKQVLGPFSKTGQHEYLFICPNCNHHKKKLSVNIDKDVFKCWICDYKGYKIQRLVRKFGSVSARHNWKEAGPSDLPSSLREYFENYYDTAPVVQKVQLPDEFETLSKRSTSRDWRSATSYLHSRGLTDRDIVYWKMGFCASGDYGGRVVIPSFDMNGNINYFVARAYKDFYFKYKNPKVDKSGIIFNQLYVDWEQDLMLVEGIFDAIKAGNAVPILGSSLKVDHKLFQEIVRHDTPVYVALDKDALRKAHSLIEKLLSYEVEVFKIDTATISTDIGDLTKTEFEDLKRSATLMTTTELLKEKMRIIM